MVTKSISAQFHVVFDDGFTTVHSNEEAAPPEWSRLITCPNSRLQTVLDEDHDPKLADEWLAPSE